MFYYLFQRWLPEDISTFGHGIDETLRLIYYIVGAWFVLVEVILFYFIFRYRRKKGQKGNLPKGDSPKDNLPKAAYQTGHSWKALAWILIPGIIILGFDVAIEAIQVSVWREIKEELPEHPDQIIGIKGRQFVWAFTHPGKDNQLGTPDDIQTLNQLTVPVHAKIVFQLESEDVLHSFWVPNLRLKQDAVPGRMIQGWFEATKEGDYVIACAELCGSGHGIMRGTLHVLNQEDYQKWQNENSIP